MNLNRQMPDLSSDVLPVSLNLFLSTALPIPAPLFLPSFLFLAPLASILRQLRASCRQMGAGGGGVATGWCRPALVGTAISARTAPTSPACRKRPFSIALLSVSSANLRALGARGPHPKEQRAKCRHGAGGTGAQGCAWGLEAGCMLLINQDTFLPKLSPFVLLNCLFAHSVRYFSGFC